MKMSKWSRSDFDNTRPEHRYDWGEGLPSVGDELVDCGTASLGKLPHKVSLLYESEAGDPIVRFNDRSNLGWYLWRFAPVALPKLLAPRLSTRGGYPVSQVEAFSDHWTALVTVKDQALRVRYGLDGYFYRTNVETPMDLVEAK